MYSYQRGRILKEKELEELAKAQTLVSPVRVRAPGDSNSVSNNMR